MSAAPTVSVVVPTHDRLPMLVRGLGAVLGQRGVDLEVVVVDDGSSDRTSAVLRKRFADRVTVIRHPESRGVSAARNSGVARARGEYVAFLDDDDVWSPVKLERQVAQLRATGRGWVYSGMVSVDVELEILHGVRPERPEELAAALPIRNRLPVGPSNVVVRRDVLDAAAARGGAPFDLGLRYHADWDLWIRLAELGPPALVDHPDIGYVLHGANMGLGSMLAEVDVIERRYADLRRGRPVDRAHVHRWVAGAHLRAGRRSDAVRAYAAAVRHAPRDSLSRLLVALSSRDHSAKTQFRKAPDEQWRDEAERWLAPLRGPLADPSEQVDTDA